MSLSEWLKMENGIPSDAMRYDACSSTFSRYLIAIPGWLCDHKVYILIVLSSKHSIIPAWNPKSAGSIPKNYSQSDSHVSIHPSTNACLFCSFIIKPQPLLIRFQPLFLYDKFQKIIIICHWQPIHSSVTNVSINKEGSQKDINIKIKVSCIKTKE